MMRLVALYAEPPDRQAFLDHYFGVHLPLVRAIPGLLSVKAALGQPMLGGPPAYFLVAELAFADAAAFELAMASPENRQAGRDLKTFAGGLATFLALQDAPG